MKRTRDFFSHQFRILILSRLYIWIGFYIFPLIAIILVQLQRNEILITLSVNSFYEVQKLMAQVLGAFAAIVIGFFFIQFQMIDSKKFSYYKEFREVLTKLKTVLYNIPKEYAYIFQPLAESIDFLDKVRLQDGIPARGDEQWNTIYKPINILMNKGLEYTYYNKKKNRFFDELVSLYGRIEEFLSLLGVLAISIIASWSILRSVVNIVCTVFYFILSYTFVVILEDNSIKVSPIILLLFLLLGFYLAIIYISALVIHILDFYREYYSEIVDDDV